MDKIFNLYKVNKKLLMSIMIITIIGIISGSLFYTVLNSEDKSTINETITAFFSNVSSSSLDYSMSLKTGLITNIIYITIIWVLGISIVGIPFILILYFIKTFTLGFTIVSIISNYAFKGVIYAFCYVFPHNVINLITFSILTIYALIYSFYTMESFIKKKVIDFGPVLSKYKTIFVIALLTVIITSLYSTFVMPYIMKILLNLVK